MATTKIKSIKKRLDHVLDYAGNPEKSLNNEYGNSTKLDDLHNVIDYIESDYKTEKKYFVSGINCNPEDAYSQMQITKKNYNKEDGILAYHIIQSFDEGEVTPELAHKIGVELCNELFADRFEVLIATHLNTSHFHNHIVLNSVSFKDGKKYYDNHETYSLIRNTSDKLCKEYGLSVLEEKKCKGSNINYDNFYKKYSSKNNYQNTAKRDLDLAISQAYSFEDFKSLMNKMDYEVIFRSGKISIRGKNYKRNIRIERAFGEDYSIENIKRRIIEEESIRIPFIESYKLKRPTYYRKTTYKKSKKKAKGIIALYYHYCFLLKVFPNTKRVNKRLPASIRADVKIMEKYSEQAKFLSKNKLNTNVELLSYKQDKIKSLNNLLSEREKLWRLRKSETNQVEKERICNKISDISAEIIKLRKEVKISEEIEARIPKINDNLKELKERENIRKENEKNEYFK